MRRLWRSSCKRTNGSKLKWWPHQGTSNGGWGISNIEGESNVIAHDDADVAVTKIMRQARAATVSNQMYGGGGLVDKGKKWIKEAMEEKRQTTLTTQQRDGMKEGKKKKSDVRRKEGARKDKIKMADAEMDVDAGAEDKEGGACEVHATPDNEGKAFGLDLVDCGGDGGCGYKGI